jgi:hypothetical protein
VAVLAVAFIGYAVDTSAHRSLPPPSPHPAAMALP